MLREAAEIFEGIGMAESAAQCFSDLGDYERAGMNLSFGIYGYTSMSFAYKVLYQFQSICQELRNHFILKHTQVGPSNQN